MKTSTVLSILLILSFAVSIVSIPVLKQEAAYPQNYKKAAMGISLSVGQMNKTGEDLQFEWVQPHAERTQEGSKKLDKWVYQYDKDGVSFFYRWPSKGNAVQVMMTNLNHNDVQIKFTPKISCKNDNKMNALPSRSVNVWNRKSVSIDIETNCKHNRFPDFELANVLVRHVE